MISQMVVYNLKIGLKYTECVIKYQAITWAANIFSKIDTPFKSASFLLSEQIALDGLPYAIRIDDSDGLRNQNLKNKKVSWD